MRFQRIWGKFSLIIDVSNDTKRKQNKENDNRYIEILILVLKTESTLNGFNFCDVNLS